MEKVGGMGLVEKENELGEDMTQYEIRVEYVWSVEAGSEEEAFEVWHEEAEPDRRSDPEIEEVEA
jgi:hypothetical protein